MVRFFLDFDIIIMYQEKIAFLREVTSEEIETPQSVGLRSAPQGNTCAGI